MTYKLLNVGKNHKTVKGDLKGQYLTGILYLAPGNLSGYEVCPARTKGCFASCLFYAGRGQMDVVQQSRIDKTKRFFERRSEFMRDLYYDIAFLTINAARAGMKPAVRLNGTSDIKWEEVSFTIDGVRYDSLMEAFPGVTFYDYTKRVDRWTPGNYFTTFSLAETKRSEDMALRGIKRGMNISVVFRDKLPETYLGRPVFDGDQDDLRFLDPQGVIVGLKAKGKARKDTSGFVK